MVTYTLDRRSTSVGGSLVATDRSAASPAADATTGEAFLALADGSVWRVRRSINATAAAGPVHLAGETVVVGTHGYATIAIADAADLASHVSALTAAEAGGSGGPYGCVSAAGATRPLHLAVTLALARREIGGP